MRLLARHYRRQDPLEAVAINQSGSLAAGRLASCVLARERPIGMRRRVKLLADAADSAKLADCVLAGGARKPSQLRAAH